MVNSSGGIINGKVNRTRCRNCAEKSHGTCERFISDYAEAGLISAGSLLNSGSVRIPAAANKIVDSDRMVVMTSKVISESD